MDEVVFEEINEERQIMRRKKRSAFFGFLERHGFLKTDKQARTILLTVMCFCLSLSAVFFFLLLKPKPESTYLEAIDTMGRRAEILREKSQSR